MGSYLMTNHDLVEFCNVWGNAYELFNRQLSDNAFQLAFNALSEFSLLEVKRGLSHALKTSKFAPTIADVSQAIVEIRGIDTASLETRANDFYNKISQNFSMGKDYVCDDPRAVYAFKTCFGSLREFGNHALSADPFDRKEFIKAYVNAKEEWYRNDNNKNVLAGIYHKDNNPLVAYVGNKTTCEQLAKVVYKDKQPRLPDYSSDKKLIINDVKSTANDKYVDMETVLQELQHISYKLKRDEV